LPHRPFCYTGCLIGYARVSTVDQKSELQVDALTATGCGRIFTDKASGSLANRPQLNRMLDHLRPDDVVVVLRLDCLGRSLRNLILLAEELKERGLGLRSLSESVDTTTANGKPFFSIMGALAEFERELVRERTMPAWRLPGRGDGRRPAAKMTPEKVCVTREMYASKGHCRGHRADEWGLQEVGLSTTGDTLTCSRKAATDVLHR
jgi:DNA invertase Pin-like site-specific DNA recombinase